jgi:hypothetical protein
MHAPRAQSPATMSSATDARVYAGIRHGRARLWAIAMLALTWLLVATTPAAAQSQRISDRPDVVTVASADDFPVDHGTCPAASPTCVTDHATALEIGTYVKSGLATVATSGSASDLTTGTLPAAQLPGVIPAISGNWYLPPFVGLNAGAAMTGSRMICQERLNVLTGLTVKALGVRITTGGSTNIALAIYANSAGRPNGAPLGFTTSIVDTTPGAVSGTVTNFSLPFGPYWACEVANDSSVILLANSFSTQTPAFVGSATQSNLNTASGLSVFQAITFPTFPTVTSSGWTELAGETTGGAVMFQAN